MMPRRPTTEDSVTLVRCFMSAAQNSTIETNCYVPVAGCCTDSQPVGLL